MQNPSYSHRCELRRSPGVPWGLWATAHVASFCLLVLLMLNPGFSFYDGLLLGPSCPMTCLIRPSSWWEVSLHGHLVTIDRLSFSIRALLAWQEQFLKGMWFSTADSMVLLLIPKALNYDSLIMPQNPYSNFSHHQYPHHGVCRIMWPKMTGLLIPQSGLMWSAFLHKAPHKFDNFHVTDYISWNSNQNIHIWLQVFIYFW